MLKAAGPLLTRVAGVIAIVLVLTPVLVAVADPPGNGVGCTSKLGCGVGAYDQGSAGQPVQLVDQPVSGTGVADSQNSTEDVTSPADPGECVWKALPSQPVTGSALWEGNDPASGTVEYTNCLSVGGTLVAPYRFVANAAPGGAPVPPPPPDPAVLAQQAYQQIPIPKPDIHVGPKPDLVAVNIPVWLWVSRAQVPPVTVTAGGVSVTATPVLTSVSWSMGEPANPDSGGATAPVVCSGEGMYTTAPEVVAPQVIPVCGYSYQWRSLKSRTGGAGTWPVSASATWVITWTSNVGQSGTITAPPANSVTNLQVGEWQTVGVYAGSNSGG
jgi:hypothetical protein